MNFFCCETRDFCLQACCVISLSHNLHFIECRNYVETLSTLRFGQRARSIKNKPVINEITEEDMDDLTDQIRQLKVYLLH